MLSEQMRHTFDVLIVGGCGHVGLPLGLSLADAGLNVALYDIDVEARRTVRAGRMPFLERGAEPLLKNTLGRTLHLVDDLSAVSRSELVLITIGTPIDEHLNPSMSAIQQLAEGLAPHLREGHQVMLRSTVRPGTTRWLRQRFHELGRAVQLSYCPERIVQGYAILELRKLPQIISGCSEEAARAATRLFERLQAATVTVSVEEAELAKLFSNAWRYIQFAIANQFYVMASEQGADFERIYRAMTEGYERASDLPRPGFAAGPCLLKDTLQLAAAYRNQFPLGVAAMMINEGMPQALIDQLTRSLGRSVQGLRVGILGMAFKADSDDIRDSLSYKLSKLLRFAGATVLCSDPYVKDPAFVSAEEVLAACEVVMIGVPHAAYRTLRMPSQVRVVDVWRVVPEPAPRAKTRPRRTLAGASARR